MNVRVVVEDKNGAIVHDRIGTINARHHRTIKAAHTRITHRLMRIYAGIWQRIEIKVVEGT